MLHKETVDFIASFFAFSSKNVTIFIVPKKGGVNINMELKENEQKKHDVITKSLEKKHDVK